MINSSVVKMLIEAEKGCRLRKYGSVASLEKSLQKAEQALLQFAGSKTSLIGTKVTIDEFRERFANAYNGIPRSTQVDCTYTRNGLRVDKIYRGYCHQGSTWLTVVYTENAKEAILRNASSIKG